MTKPSAYIDRRFGHRSNLIASIVGDHNGMDALGSSRCHGFDLPLDAVFCQAGYSVTMTYEHTQLRGSLTAIARKYATMGEIYQRLLW